MQIELELQHHVTSGYLPTGSPIHFRVLEDVTVQGQTLIRKGTLVTGKMEHAQNRGMVGRSGWMTLGVHTVPAVDGTNVPVEADLAKQGHSRAVATVGWTLFWGLPGLITRGVNPYLERGSAIEATVTNEVSIDPAPSQPATGEREAAPLHMQVRGHKFAAAHAPTFVFDIERNEDLKTVSFQLQPPVELVDPAAALRTVELVSVDGVAVPEPVRAVSATANSVTFSDWSIIQFCRDGVTSLYLPGTALDGRAFDGDYELRLKIKK